MVGVQRGDGESALVAPFVSLSDEHARQTGFVSVLFEFAPAAKAIRAISQDCVDLVEVPDGDDAPLT
jgi:hypothetical protein